MDESGEFIKVIQNDSTNQNVNLKNIKPINNIKVVRQKEESYTSSDESISSYASSEPVKKTKKILRKKEGHHQPPPQARHQPQRNHDFSAFSNPKKISTQVYESESEYTESEDAESEYSEESGDDQRQPVNSFEDKQKLKQDLLIKIAALEKKGFEFSKKFTMASNYEEMMFEFNKIKKFIETQAGIKFARRCLMACVTGVEFLNKKFDPFNIKLEGWSENVMENVDDYDNIFESLHEKYSSKAEVSPEIELLLMLGGSAFMFHLTNSLLKGPTLNNMVAQNNPNFMASMMGAMSQGMKEMNRPPPPQAMPGSSNFPPPMETRGIRKEMRGPTMDQGLFSGTPLATNYPSPPNFTMKNQVNGPPVYNSQPIYNSQNNKQSYYEENPINDDDRFSVLSSDDSMSTVSLGSTVKTINTVKKSKKGGGGLELNIK